MKTPILTKCQANYQAETFTLTAEKYITPPKAKTAPKPKQTSLF